MNEFCISKDVTFLNSLSQIQKDILIYYSLLSITCQQGNHELFSIIINHLKEVQLFL